MKNKKFKKLKNAYLFQAEKNDSQPQQPNVIPDQTPEKPNQIEKEIPSQEPQKPTSNYSVKTNPYLNSDLKRVFVIVLAAAAILTIAVLLQKNSHILQDFGNFLYKLLHLG